MEPDNGTFKERRHLLVEELRPIVPDEKALSAILKTPRHEFVPEELREQAYLNQALSIGFGQTISQPQIVAMMTAALNCSPNDRILEIGLGSGYQAAVLSTLVADVYSIELVPELGKQTISLLDKLGYTNIHARIGDGTFGWPDQSPFDGIIVTAAPERIPQQLISQLKDGGHLVIPVGSESQHLKLYTKQGGTPIEKDLGSVRFVPMLGAVRERD